MSGLDVIGGISAVINIIDASIKIYNSARKDLKLSEAFEAVGRRLPIILDTLQTCKSHLEPTKVSLPADACEALEKILNACDDKADKLRKIFEKVIPDENEAWETRYLKVFKRLGKGNKVEELMMLITEDVQLVVNNHAVKSATPEQNSKLEDIVKEMNSVESSVPGEGTLGNTFNSGGGAQANNFNYGSGSQTNYNAPIANQHNHMVNTQKPDYSFRRPAGHCLGQVPCVDAFIGRESELDQMKDILMHGSKSGEHRRLVLGGKGGVGKTQLAIAYASRHPDDYKSVFWLNATSEATVKDSFRSIANRLFDFQEPGALEGEQVVIHVYRWLSYPENTKWLLIFDNYDDPGQFDIHKYYPFASHGAIVVTTRRPGLVTGSKIRVEPLKNIEESLEILETRSQRKDAKHDPHARLLATRLGGLPLALATAGAYLHTSHFTFKCYLQLYEERWEIDKRRSLQLPEYQDRTLYTTWDLSYTRLESERPDAAKLLKLLAYFDNQSIWYELLHAGLADDSPEWLREVIADEVNFAGVMRTLTDYCFLDLQKPAGVWSMHNCVHDWTLAALNTDIDAQQYWYAFDCIASSITKDDEEYLWHVSYAHLAAHAKRLVHDRFLRDGVLDDILADRFRGVSLVARLLALQVQHPAAEQMYQRVLAGQEQALGPTHQSTLRTVEKLGNVYFRQHKMAQAEQMYQRALAGREQVLGSMHPAALETVNNLGSVYYRQGKMVQAAQMYQRALAGQEQELGPTHPSTLETVSNLGRLYYKQGKMVQAKQMLQRALAGPEQELAPTHPSTLRTLRRLGRLYRDQGQMERAEQLSQRVVLGYEKVLGPDHPRTLEAVSDLNELRVDVERNANNSQSAERSHNSSKRRVDRLKSLLRRMKV